MEQQNPKQNEKGNKEKLTPEEKKNKIVTLALYGAIGLCIIGYLVWTINQSNKSKEPAPSMSQTVTGPVTDESQPTLKVDPNGNVQVGGEQNLPKDNRDPETQISNGDAGYAHSQKNIEWIDDPTGSSAACQIKIPLGFTVNRSGNTIYIKPENMQMDGVTSSGPITVAWFDAVFMDSLHSADSDKFSSDGKTYTILKKYQYDTGNGVHDCYYLKCEQLTTVDDYTENTIKYIIAVDYKMSGKYLLVTVNEDSVNAMLTGRYDTIDTLMLAIIPEA